MLNWTGNHEGQPYYTNSSFHGLTVLLHFQMKLNGSPEAKRLWQQKRLHRLRPKGLRTSSTSCIASRVRFPSLRMFASRSLRLFSGLPPSAQSIRPPSWSNEEPENPPVRGNLKEEQGEGGKHIDLAHGAVRAPRTIHWGGHGTSNRASDISRLALTLALH